MLQSPIHELQIKKENTWNIPIVILFTVISTICSKVENGKICQVRRFLDSVEVTLVPGNPSW